MGVRSLLCAMAAASLRQRTGTVYVYLVRPALPRRGVRVYLAYRSLESVFARQGRYCNGSGAEVYDEEIETDVFGAIADDYSEAQRSGPGRNTDLYFHYVEP